MSKVLNQNIITNTATDPQTGAPTPEQIVEQLRALRIVIPDVTPLTSKERRAIRGMNRTSDDVLVAQIALAGASTKVETAIGRSADEARQLVADESRWMAVELELKALLSGVSGGNLIRRQQIQLLGAQAYTIGASLAKSSANAELVPHVAEVRRLKRTPSRKKSGPETPAPQTTPPAPADQHTNSGT